MSTTNKPEQVLGDNPERVTVRLTQAQFQEVEGLADGTSFSRSDVIRDAIDEYEPDGRYDE